jgi:ABC-type spermidine/putrescine transport system permease subunit I
LDRGEGSFTTGRNGAGGVLPILLLSPGVLLCGVLLAGALVSLAITSLQIYIPGRMGLAVGGGFTIANYADFLGSPAHLRYLMTTLRIAAVASAVTLILSYPIALLLLDERRRILRRVILYVLIGSFFLNTIARIYAWVLILGDQGVVNSILSAIGKPEILFLTTETAVVLGIVHFLIPIAALSLAASLSNIDRAVFESAASLGADPVATFLRITVPMSLPGLISAFALTFSLSVSAFVVPLILGGGIILMVSNLVYARFSEIANYQSGAALAVVLLVVTFLVSYGVERGLTGRLAWLKRAT